MHVGQLQGLGMGGHRGLGPLVEALAQPRNFDPIPAPAALMQSIDQDRDGLVSEADLAAWMGSFQAFDPSMGSVPSVAHRAVAGVIDAVVIGLPFFVVGKIFGDFWSVFGLASGLGYAFRDCLFNNGTRSLGKKLMSLEIVTMKKDASGALQPTDDVATLQDNFARNSYGIVSPFSNIPFLPYGAYGVTSAAAGLLSVADCYFLVFTDSRRSVGDQLATTMVVPEGSNIAQRSLARSLREGTGKPRKKLVDWSK